MSDDLEALWNRMRTKQDGYDLAQGQSPLGVDLHPLTVTINALRQDIQLMREALGATLCKFEMAPGILTRYRDEMAKLRLAHLELGAEYNILKKKLEKSRKKK